MGIKSYFIEEAFMKIDYMENQMKTKAMDCRDTESKEYDQIEDNF